jgi:hypothetical protein
LQKNPEWKIFKNTVVGGDGSMPTYTTGGLYCYVMTQDQESIDNAKSLINAVLNQNILAEDKDGNVYNTEATESEGEEQTDEQL